MYARGMRGIGTKTSAECAADPVCGALQRAWCWSGGYFQADCQKVRDGIFAPPAVKAPVLSTAAGTYGQPLGPDGKVISTSGEAEALIDAQIAASHDAMIEQNQDLFKESWLGYVGSTLPVAEPDGLGFLPVALGIAAVAAFMLVKN